MPRLTLYHRSGCAESESARRVLERVRPYEPFDLEEVDINQDRVAYGLHHDTAPVLKINGQTVFRHRIDEDRLIRRLRLVRQQLIAEEEERRRRGNSM